jgi:hypothetical protein
MTSDDERQAALMKTSISNYVGTATLALIAGGVALFTYIQQNFKASAGFYVLVAIAVVTLVSSFIFGGKGANTTTEELARGTWTKDTKIREFNWQAILTLAGLISLIAATAVGTATHQPSKKDPCVMLLSHQLANPYPNLKQLRKELTLCEAARS